MTPRKSLYIKDLSGLRVSQDFCDTVTLACVTGVTGVTGATVGAVCQCYRCYSRGSGAVAQRDSGTVGQWCSVTKKRAQSSLNRTVTGFY